MIIKTKKSDAFVHCALTSLMPLDISWGVERVDLEHAQITIGVDKNGNASKYISEEEVYSAIEAHDSNVKANEYKVLRANDYPSLTEQEDMKYWDAINGTTVWLDTITEIKNKYPKGA